MTLPDWFFSLMEVRSLHFILFLIKSKLINTCIWGQSRFCLKENLSLEMRVGINAAFILPSVPPIPSVVSCVCELRFHLPVGSWIIRNIWFLFLLLRNKNELKELRKKISIICFVYSYSYVVWLWYSRTKWPYSSFRIWRFISILLHPFHH